MLLIGLGIATIIPLVSLYAIRALDFYHTGSQRMVILSFMWGVLSFGIASLLATQVFARIGLDPTAFRVIVAPTVEEFVKGLILLYLIRNVKFTYFVDGAIYGFAIGIGFAVIENASYLFNNPQVAVPLAGARVLSVNLIHASASALIGIALALARFRRGSGGITLGLLGLLLAITLHAAFNRMVTVTTSGMLITYSITVGLGALVFIGLAIRRGLADERRWIEETLVEVEHITRAERDAVGNLDHAGRLISSLRERFGNERADQIHHFLLLQARIGILRKAQDKYQNDEDRARTEEQIAEAYQQMDELRRRVGAYAMLYLRNTFPDDVSPLWDRLSLAVDEQIRIHRDSAPKVNVFDRLGEILEAARARASESDE